MIEVRIIQFTMQNRDGNYAPGIKSTETLVASMLTDGWEIKSFQYTESDPEHSGTGVFVMVRDVEPVVEAADSDTHNSMSVLFDILSKDTTIGALRPGLLWQVQYALVAVAKWLLANGLPDTSILGCEAKDYIRKIEGLQRAGELRQYAKGIHAEYLAVQKDGE